MIVVPAQRLKIAHVVSTPPFTWGAGGSARVVYDQAKELARRGHKVSVITTDLHPPTEAAVKRHNPEMVDGFDLFRFPCISNTMAWKSKIYISTQLAGYLKKHVSEYDIVHLQDLISYHAVATARSCIRNGVPYVITAHGSIPWLQEPKLIHRIYSDHYGRMILERASRISALTSSELEQYVGYGVSKQKVEIIPNGIDPEGYQALPQKGLFRSKHGIGQDEKMVLFLGRIHEIKGLDLLVDAFAEVEKRIEKVKLVIVGPDDGYLHVVNDRIRKHGVGKNVAIIGPIYGEEKWQALVDADVFALPSRYDAFPMALLEALACGTPVVVTTGCAISDLAERAGRVVRFDASEFAGATATLLEDRGAREALGAQGRELMLREYTWTSIIDKVEALYRSAMGVGE